jgi:hypothetical protein
MCPLSLTVFCFSPRNGLTLIKLGCELQREDVGWQTEEKFNLGK